MSQSDLLVKTALEAGLQELRVRPDWLDYCFAWLPKDDLTAPVFGEKEACQAKKWFLATRVDVVAGHRVQPTKDMACVSVTMIRDGETGNTLQDLHYKTVENKGESTPLCDPFVPLAYSPVTGIMRLPPEAVAQVYAVPGQLLVDRLGRTATIREKVSRDEIRIDRNAILEVSGLVVRGRFPAKQVTLRNAYFEEAFLVGCHAMGEHVHALWLYTVVKFTLLRVRGRLLEGRGFDCSSISGTDLKEIQYLDTSSQPGFARYLTLTGKALNVWPDEERETPESIEWSWTFSARGSSGSVDPQG